MGRRGLLVSCTIAILAGCRYIPSLPSAPNSSTSEAAAVAAEEAPRVLTPPLRGLALYSDLSPETEPGTGADYDVDISPDATKLAFSSTRHTALPKIFLKDGKNGSLYQKTSGPGRDIQPKFSPDGKWIAFASDREGNFDILAIPTDRNEAYWQLTDGDSDEIHPTWSPDGKSLAYCARDKSGEWLLWILEIAGKHRTQLGPGLYPEWSPDGATLAFQRPSQRGEGWYGVWTVGVEGGAPREIAVHESFACIQPAWSPNSSRLVYAVATTPLASPFEPPRPGGLWVIDLSDGHRFRLSPNDTSGYAPSWGLNGRIYFSSSRDGTSQIWSLVPASAETPRTPAEDDEWKEGNGR